MPAKKPAPKRKRRVPAPAGPKKKQTVAAKKKHVRELAKNGQWGEIERLYGEKILAKAKTYVETQRVKKTPLEIANEILIKNGYMPVASQTAANAANQTEEKGAETSTTQNISNSNSNSMALTKEQQKLIETKRQEALARRRRNQQAGVRPPVVIQPDPTEETDKNLHQARAPTQGHHLPPQDARMVSSRRPCTLPTNNTHRVVTPENNSTTKSVVETEPTRPDSFWDDLEAAADIVQWENEHMAEVTLEQDRKAKTFQNDVRNQTVPQIETATTRSSDVPSISQELAAAAEIIEWEQKHQDIPEMPASIRHSDNELDNVPQFQLLPVHVTDDFEQQNKELTEPVRPRIDTKSRYGAPKSFSPPIKHPVEATPSDRRRFTQQRNSNVSSSAAQKASREQREHLPSPENNRNPMTEFVNKHLLEDKLDIAFIEFLDMMLA